MNAFTLNSKMFAEIGGTGIIACLVIVANPLPRSYVYTGKDRVYSGAAACLDVDKRR